ncbi:carbohydrate ABC transporter permease [Actinomyces sp. S4-C9]|uniref:carbohydrate ABC transporter permease n=1 Tax=Actinomyces sp. S4-C9 TaxID=1219581 RepID=UPI00050DCC3D|nr:carbohydrate ABC transporter permease [Actinomyces sp. S4-C9]KGF01349.1 sugar ABC transporter permease [Actinomyces sp. S4-C9]
MSRHRLIPTLAKYAALVFLLVIWMFPIALAIYKSVSVGGVENYARVLRHDTFNYWQAIGNSALMAMISTIVIVIIASLGGYAFSKMEFRGRKVLYSGLMACLAVSIASVVTPVFYVFNSLGLRDSYTGVIIPMISFNAIMMLMIMKTHFDGLPNEIIEAGLIDGASPFEIFRKILMPISGSSVATISVLSFVYTWNEYLLPQLLMKSATKFPVTKAISLLQFDRMSQQDISVLYAGLILMTLPTLLIYLFSQRFLQSGMTSGAVKS